MGVSRRALLRSLVAMPVVACSAGGVVDLPARPLRIATGNREGVYEAYGEGIAAAVRERLPTLRVEVARTHGSVDNLERLANEAADVAFSLADASANAIGGNEPFPAPLRLAALARLYDNYAHVVVRADAPLKVKVIGDLAGKVVSTGSPKSGTSLLADRILATAQVPDVKKEPLRLSAATKALAAGRIAAFFWSGGLPTKAIQELAETTAVRLLDLTDVAAKLAEEHDVYVQATVPASAYGFDFDPIPTLSVPNYLVVRADEDDKLAYQLTKLLFTERDRIGHPEARRLNLRSAISTYPLDLHPGAERYYGEAKD